MLVLENYGSLDQLQQAARWPRWPPGFIAGVDSHRRQAHFVPLLNAILRIDALAIHPYFTLAQQPVDPAAGHGLEVAHQKIVHSLTGLVGGHRAQDHRGFWGMEVRCFSAGAVHGLRSCSWSNLLRY